MEVVYFKRWTLSDAESNPDTLFIFGDNMEGVGCGGQACIRYSRANNVYGIPTKKNPAMNYPESFFSDSEIELTKNLYVKIFSDIPLNKFKKLALPTDGLGTGLAQMPSICPKTFKMLKKFVSTLVKLARSQP